MRRKGFAAVGALAAAVVVAMFALVGSASAQPPKAYLVQFPTAPLTATSAGTATFSVVVTNESPNIGMGAINFIVPSGIHVMSVNAQAPTSVSGVSWAASVPASGCVAPQTNKGNLPCITANGSRIGSGQTVTVTITIAAPYVCDGASHISQWPTDAREANNFSGTGNVLAPDTGNRNWNTTTTVQDPASADQLVFSQQPNNAQVGQPITGNSYAAGPAVQVTAMNQCGVDTAYSTPISISDTPPSYVTNSALSGGGAVTPTNGVATFANLVVNKANPTLISSAAGQGYTLTASSGALASTTSNAFDISDTSSTACTQVQGGSPGSCTTSQSSPTNAPNSSSLTIVGTGNPNNGNNSQLYENVDSGTALSCNFVAGAPVDGNWYQFNLNNTTWSKQLTYILVPTDTTHGDSAANLQVCFGSTTDFLSTDGAMAGSGTLPDGTSGFVGLLPNCTANNGSPTPGATYCIQSRSTVAATNPYGFNFQVVVNVPAGVPGDPWART